MEAEMIDSKTESGRVNKLDRSSKTMLLVTTAMMTAMVMIATTFFKLPNAMGYIHLGDGFVLLSAIVLPRKCACFAGGVGAALADIYGGYAVWAPWTLVIKAIMVIIVQIAFGYAMNKMLQGRRLAGIAGLPLVELFAYAISVVWTVTGYYVAQGVIYGNWVAPIADMPGNVLQAVVGAVIAIAVSTALSRTSWGKHFFYRRSMQ